MGIGRRLSPIEEQRWFLLAPAGLAWTLLLLQGGGVLPPALCLSPLSPAPSRLRFEWEAALASPWLTGTLQAWGLMLAAMMLPLLTGPLLQIRMQSFSRRRSEAKGLFLAGYASAWAAGMAGLFALVLIARAIGAGQLGTIAPALMFALAAGWHGSRWRRRALFKCHRPFDLAAFGWRARRDCVRYGLGHGGACLAACWPLMAALSFAGHSLMAMAAVAAILFAERHEMRPQIRAGQLLILLLALAAMLDPPVVV